MWWISLASPHVLRPVWALSTCRKRTNTNWRPPMNCRTVRLSCNIVVVVVGSPHHKRHIENCKLPAGWPNGGASVAARGAFVVPMAPPLPRGARCIVHLRHTARFARVVPRSGFPHVQPHAALHCLALHGSHGGHPPLDGEAFGVLGVVPLGTLAQV